MNELTIPHTLQLSTTINLDKMSPSLKQRMLSLSLAEQQDMLAGMARTLLVDNSINELNAGNSWATLEIK